MILLHEFHIMHCVDRLWIIRGDMFLLHFAYVLCKGCFCLMKVDFPDDVVTFVSLILCRPCIGHRVTAP